MELKDRLLRLSIALTNWFVGLLGLLCSQILQTGERNANTVDHKSTTNHDPTLVSRSLLDPIRFLMQAAGNRSMHSTRRVWAAGPEFALDDDFYAQIIADGDSRLQCGRVQGWLQQERPQWLHSLRFEQQYIASVIASNVGTWNWCAPWMLDQIAQTSNLQQIIDHFQQCMQQDQGCWGTSRLQQLIDEESRAWHPVHLEPLTADTPTLENLQGAHVMLLGECTLNGLLLHMPCQVVGNKASRHARRLGGGRFLQLRTKELVGGIATDKTTPQELMDKLWSTLGSAETAIACTQQPAGGRAIWLAGRRWSPVLWKPMDGKVVLFAEAGAGWLRQDGAASPITEMTAQELFLLEIPPCPYNNGISYQKALSYSSLAFSQTADGGQLLETEVDIIRDADNDQHSDGCGFIRWSYMEQVCSQMGHQPTKSAIQVRWAGCKGMLVAVPDEDWQALHQRVRHPASTKSACAIKVMFRFSQRKVDIPCPDYWQRMLGVLAVPQPSKGSTAINHHVLLLLSSAEPCRDLLLEMVDQALLPAQELTTFLGTDLSHTAVQDLQELLGSVAASGQHDDRVEVVQKMLRAGFAVSTPRIQLMLCKLVQLLLLRVCDVPEAVKAQHRKRPADKHKYLLPKVSVNVPESLVSFIIPDPTGTLCEGEIFYHNSERRRRDNFKQLRGPVLMYRTPLHRVEHIALVTAVDNPRLRHIQDVIVCNTQDTQAIAAQLAGDYDGDKAVIIWSPDMVEAWQQGRSPASAQALASPFVPPASTLRQHSQEPVPAATPSPPRSIRAAGAADRTRLRSPKQKTAGGMGPMQASGTDSMSGAQQGLFVARAAQPQPQQLQQVRWVMSPVVHDDERAGAQGGVNHRAYVNNFHVAAVGDGGSNDVFALHTPARQQAPQRILFRAQEGDNQQPSGAQSCAPTGVVAPHTGPGVTSKMLSKSGRRKVQTMQQVGGHTAALECFMRDTLRTSESIGKVDNLLRFVHAFKGANSSLAVRLADLASDALDAPKHAGLLDHQAIAHCEHAAAPWVKQKSDSGFFINKVVEKVKKVYDAIEDKQPKPEPGAWPEVDFPGEEEWREVEQEGSRLYNDLSHEVNGIRENLRRQEEPASLRHKKRLYDTCYKKYWDLLNDMAWQRYESRTSKHTANHNAASARQRTEPPSGRAAGPSFSDELYKLSYAMLWAQVQDEGMRGEYQERVWKVAGEYLLEMHKHAQELNRRRHCTLG